MARLTESGAFAGARANPPRSRASFPGVVGPEEGNERAKLACAVKTKIAAKRTGFRTGILTRLSISVCRAALYLKKSPGGIAQIFRNALEPSLVAPLGVAAIDPSRKPAVTSILLVLERCNFLLGAADLGFSPAAQSQKFFLAAEIYERRVKFRAVASRRGRLRCIGRRH